MNLVEVRVVVRDAKGNAVGNLKQDDFIVLDDKKPQTITRFQWSATGPQQPRAIGQPKLAGSAGA